MAYRVSNIMYNVPPLARFVTHEDAGLTGKEYLSYALEYYVDDKPALKYFFHTSHESLDTESPSDANKFTRKWYSQEQILNALSTNVVVMAHINYRFHKVDVYEFYSYDPKYEGNSCGVPTSYSIRKDVKMVVVPNVSLHCLDCDSATMVFGDAMHWLYVY